MEEDRVWNLIISVKKLKKGRTQKFPSFHIELLLDHFFYNDLIFGLNVQDEDISWLIYLKFDDA